MAEQPGAAPPSDKDAELEKMKKLLAEKDAKLKEMEQKLADKDNDGDTTMGGDNDENESKLPPKTDVTLQLRGIPEYDSYPFSLEAEKFFFMASVKAPYFRAEQRASIDLVAVVDESGSMGGERIKLVKETVTFIIKNLESGDRFGIVGYSSGSRLVLPLTKMDEKGREKAIGLASQLRASGGTALCAGLVQGVNLMRNRKGTMNDVASVMLFTDGQANEGPTSAAQINACVRSGKVGGGGGFRSSYGGPPMLMQQQMAPKKLQKNVKRKKKMVKKKRVSAPPQLQQQGVPPPQIQQQQMITPQIQQQGVPSPQLIVSDDELKEKEGQKKDLFDTDLPCTINTFGFGSGHNESLLESLAENGRGMYAFIENTDMIADTFAECLGGLVSIIGQDLKVKVEALNNVEINKCLSTGYTLSVVEPKKIHEISIKDLQSEENRELIFELKMPKIGAAKENDPIIQLSVAYTNVVKDKKETLSNVTTIHRIDGTQIGERNIELDVQYNRVLAAKAMEDADQLANAGKLEEARKVLTSAQDHIKKSKSNQSAYSKNLVNDIELVSNNMRSRQQYQRQGGKMLKMNKKAHMMQRSVQSSAYASQAVYQNRSKSAMKKKFKSKK